MRQALQIGKNRKYKSVNVRWCGTVYNLLMEHGGHTGQHQRLPREHNGGGETSGGSNHFDWYLVKYQAVLVFSGTSVY